MFGWFLFSFLGVWISFSLNSKSFTVKARIIVGYFPQLPLGLEFNFSGL